MNKIIKIKAKELNRLSKYKKTHNLYAYTDSKGNFYYKAIPKPIKKAKKEQKVEIKKPSYLWLGLSTLAIILATVAFILKEPKVDAITEVTGESETVEVIEEAIEEEPIKESEETMEITQYTDVYTGVCSEWYDLVAQYDWDVKIALAVMKAESNCNPNAVNYNTNGTQDTGLFQLNSFYWAQTFNPEENIKEAYRVYTRSGYRWTPWVVYNTGKYLEYLD